MATTELSSEAAATAEPQSWWVEKHSIDPIPEDQRNGKLYTAFTVWITLNATPLSIAAGAFGIALNLPIWACILAIVVGSLIGAVPTAMHAGQGPQLGLPQMIQSRAQFGFFGNLIPSLGGAVLTYFIYNTLGIVLVEQAFSGLFGWAPVTSVVVAVVLIEIVAVLGYRVIHLVNAGMAVVLTVLFVLFTLKLLTETSQIQYSGTFTMAAFLSVVVFEVVGQLGNAPFISDYTRYLPADTKFRWVFLGAFVGGAGSAILMTIVGVIAAALDFNAVNSNTVGYMSSLFPAISTPIAVVLTLTVAAIVAMGTYSGYQTIMALITSRGGSTSALLSRTIVTGLFAIACGVTALTVSQDFIINMGNFVSNLIYILVPWSAINLTDYFVVRRGRFDVDAIADRNGRYGLFDWRGIGVFVLGVLVQVPFIVSGFPTFTGPIANALGGLNFAWLVGFVVTAVVYWLVERGGADRKGLSAAMSPGR